jgi:hypothetical protein
VLERDGELCTLYTFTMYMNKYVYNSTVDKCMVFYDIYCDVWFVSKCIMHSATFSSFWCSFHYIFSSSDVNKLALMEHKPPPGAREIWDKYNIGSSLIFYS